MLRLPKDILRRVFYSPADVLFSIFWLAIVYIVGRTIFDLIAPLVVLLP